MSPHNPERARLPVRRLAFANQLRGVAAILVACSHLLGVYWAVPQFVAAATFSPVQTGVAPAAYDWVDDRWFQLGPFGVGLFFLISGLVIPYSLARHTRLTFLVARMLRIYPLFILALLIELGVLYAAAYYWQRPFTYGAGTIVANLLLVANLTGAPVIDFVNWTLTIELEFYLMVLLLAGVIRRGSILALIGVAIGLVALAVLIGRHPAGGDPSLGSRMISGFGFELQYLVFMLIGVAFNFHNSGQLGTRGLLAGGAAMVLLFATAAAWGVAQPEYRVVAGNYCAALAVFGTLYAARHRIRDNRALDFVASISFPFYLIHAVIGFTMIKILMMVFHLNYDAALLGSIGAITLIAYFLHRTIEEKTIGLGHRLSGRYRQTASDVDDDHGVRIGRVRSEI
ncbi:MULTISPECIES: acyltransferase family protein [Acidiphilium]|uniref:Peptidoglycan/LPS O-acetylase OafA/YrhL, contains acyltransferase and SGNH-hydrolase domains n=1 Tax=Acidiphilium rubrum TaxID=526 RepID=A0A8G2FLG6_ACIRU|nr:MULTISPECIES: acyltransferase [Acidiphilium]SIQ91079.1 Peptidoglycan/LPS O-acetylase OafA/YrhL, contains acyltransferase and SGNH-hydrolase domains [Acidiphilium rubrum]